MTGMVRRIVLAVLLLAALPGSSAAGPPRIGVLLYSSLFNPAFEGLRDGLLDLGIEEGRDVVFEVHDLEWKLESLPQLIQRFRQQPVSLLFTTTTPLTRQVQSLNRRDPLPVVFSMVASPLQSGLVASLRQPGGHTTGISHIAFETLPRRLILFKTAFPGMRRVALFFDPDEPFLKGQIDRNLRGAADDLGIELVELPVSGPDEMERLTARLTRKEIDGIFMLPDPRSVSMLDRLQQLASRERLPLMVVDNSLLARAGVMAYSPAFYQVGRQAAGIVASVLRGADAGSLPVQNPDLIKLVVSMKEADRLGLRPSDEILAQAGEIIR